MLMMGIIFPVDIKLIHFFKKFILDIVAREVTAK